MVVLLLAGWLLYVNVRHRANRAFAFFLLTFAASTFHTWLFVAAGRVEGQPPPALIEYSRPFILIPMTFSVFYFLAVYPYPRTWFGKTRAGAWTYWGAAAGLMAAVAIDPQLYVNYGPLRFIEPRYWIPSFLIAAYVLARDYLRVSDNARAGSYLTVSLGFALLGAWWTLDKFPYGLVGLGWIPRAPYAGQDPIGPGLIFTVLFWGSLAWFFFIMLVATLLRRLASPRFVDERRTLRRYMALLGTSFLTAVILVVLVYTSKAVDQWDVVFAGIWRLALPLLVTYAMVRHQLFGIDVKIRWTIKQSTVAAAFIAVFFIVSGVAQTFLQSTGLGPYLGIAAAGLLVFGLAPLQHFAERVANAAMPGVRPLGEMSSDERANVYRATARSAWADGSLSRDERRLLDGLRERLGLSRDQAFHLESEAAHPDPPGGPPRPASAESPTRKKKR